MNDVYQLIRTALAQKLVEDAHGIWRSATVGALAYPEEGNERCFLIEDKSFWFNHRNDCIAAALRRHLPSGLILDIGGGNGFVARRMMDEGYATVLIEPGPAGAYNARRNRGLPLVVCATLEETGLPAETADAATLFDVLEHIPDDRAFLEPVSRVLKPGGWLVLTVPAHRWLWSQSDDRAQHCRRYSRAQLLDVLAERFDPVYCTHYFGALVLPTLLMRALPYRIKPSRRQGLLPVEQEHGTGGGPMVRLLTARLRPEVARIAAGKSMAWGGSLLCVARKR